MFLLQNGDLVGLVKTSDGRLRFFVNDLDQGVAARDVPDGAYGVIDLHGKTTGICLTAG